MQVKTPIVLFLLAISVKLFRDVFRLNMKTVLEVAWVKGSQSTDVAVCMMKNVIPKNVQLMQGFTVPLDEEVKKGTDSTLQPECQINAHNHMQSVGTVQTVGRS